jgi:predicted AlkP superfamily pyrophosphatase or phosphodiesterase
MSQPPPLVLINCVGLTGRLLPAAPRLSALASRGRAVPMKEVLPAVTCTAQASMLTGRPPSSHGIVANGWLYRDTREVRFWQQSNALLEAEPAYRTVRRIRAAQGRAFTCAKLFWWFNQGSGVDYSLTPKPHYGCDGDKAFDVAGRPADLPDAVRRDLGPFPFPAFWGPAAGLASTEWIAGSAARVLQRYKPDFTLVYLPHLDYDPQRFGPGGCDMTRIVGELDASCEILLDACRRMGARVWIVSEYGHQDVNRPVYLNRALRESGLLEVRSGPFGETLDAYESRAFAVCDHQIAHVYVRDPEDVEEVRELVASQPGVGRTYAGDERAEIFLDHPRSGETIALAEPGSWFAYPYWLDDSAAPDFARTVDIHRKPGFDPCELFFDPKLAWPKLRAARRLLAKRLGFRTRMDVIPLEAEIVRGSHGLAAADPLDRPILVVDDPNLGPSPASDFGPADVHALVLEALTQ